MADRTPFRRRSRSRERSRPEGYSPPRPYDDPYASRSYVSHTQQDRGNNTRYISGGGGGFPLGRGGNNSGGYSGRGGQNHGHSRNQSGYPNNNNNNNNNSRGPSKTSSELLALLHTIPPSSLEAIVNISSHMREESSSSSTTTITTTSTTATTTTRHSGNPFDPTLDKWRLIPYIGATIHHMKSNCFQVDTRSMPSQLYEYSVTIYKLNYNDEIITTDRNSNITTTPITTSTTTTTTNNNNNNNIRSGSSTSSSHYYGESKDSADIPVSIPISTTVGATTTTTNNNNNNNNTISGSSSSSSHYYGESKDSADIPVSIPISTTVGATTTPTTNNNNNNNNNIRSGSSTSSSHYYGESKDSADIPVSIPISTTVGATTTTTTTNNNNNNNNNIRSGSSTSSSHYYGESKDSADIPVSIPISTTVGATTTTTTNNNNNNNTISGSSSSSSHYYGENKDSADIPVSIPISTTVGATTTPTTTNNNNNNTISGSSSSSSHYYGESKDSADIPVSIPISTTVGATTTPTTSTNTTNTTTSLSLKDFAIDGDESDNLVILKTLIESKDYYQVNTEGEAIGITYDGRKSLFSTSLLLSPDDIITLTTPITTTTTCANTNTTTNTTTSSSDIDERFIQKNDSSMHMSIEDVAIMDTGVLNPASNNLTDTIQSGIPLTTTTSTTMEISDYDTEVNINSDVEDLYHKIIYKQIRENVMYGQKYIVQLQLTASQPHIPPPEDEEWLNLSPSTLRALDSAICSFAKWGSVNSTIHKTQPPWLLDRNKIFRFNPDDMSLNDSGTLICRKGYQSSFKSCLAGLILQVDLSCTPYLRGGMILDILWRIMKMRSMEDMLRTLKSTYSNSGGSSGSSNRGGSRNNNHTHTTNYYNSQDMKYFKDFITLYKNTKCVLIHLNHTRKIHDLGPPADHLDSSFEYNGKYITVSEYYSLESQLHPEKYSPVQYPFLPLINIGSKNKPTYIPMEFIYIKEGQMRTSLMSGDITSKIIKEAAMRPSNRIQYILGINTTSSSSGNSNGPSSSSRYEDNMDSNVNESVSFLDSITNDDNAMAFGLAGISKEVMTVSATLLPPPTLLYGNTQQIDPALEGSWFIPNNYSFYKLPPPSTQKIDSESPSRDVTTPSRTPTATSTTKIPSFEYSIMFLSDGRPPNNWESVCDHFIHSLEQEAKIHQLHLILDGRYELSTVQASDINNTLTLFKRRKIDLVVCILQSEYSYSLFKYSADSMMILSQCVKYQKIQKMNKGYVANLLLKVNTKLGGTNHSFISRGSLTFPSISSAAAMSSSSSSSTSNPRTPTIMRDSSHIVTPESTTTHKPFSTSSSAASSTPIPKIKKVDTSANPITPLNSTSTPYDLQKDKEKINSFQDPPHSLSWMFHKPSMLVGIDLSHPDPGQKRGSTIAAVVASMNGTFSQYGVHLITQNDKDDICVGVADAMVSLLTAFKQRNHTLPKHIIVYRDGVNDTQFNDVVTKEVQAIHEAMMTFGEIPNDSYGLTVIVAQKRHKTRVVLADTSTLTTSTPYSQSSIRTNENSTMNNNYNNPCPGVCLDAKNPSQSIVSSKYIEFYLCSHSAIQGTSKPCKYTVIYDDVGLKLSELELLTYWSTYLYCRCNKSVSYATPAYYAHWAARKGRHWLAGGATPSNVTSVTKEWLHSSTPMYFI